IKGLQAKPIIDLMLGVQHLEEVSHYISLLSQIDYEYVLKLNLKIESFLGRGQGDRELAIFIFVKFMVVNGLRNDCFVITLEYILKLPKSMLH
ncbi:MAG: GrpB family protein, partial [Anaerobacillus sp.]